jgi:hypothetical protein
MWKFCARLTPAALALMIGGVATLASCKRPETNVGLDLQSAGDLLSAYQTDTLKLRLTVVREDSLETDNLSTAVIGRMWHPLTGWHKGSLATQLRLSAPDVDFGENPVIDSLYLSLHYTGSLFGQPAAQRLMVHRLTEPVLLDSTYYSNRDWQMEEVDLADNGFQPIVLDPNREVIIGEDTLSPELRIYLTDEFGQSLLDADPAVYASNTEWTDFLPGLFIAPTATGAGDGAVGIDLANGLSELVMHYHNDTDTLVYEFSINALCGRANHFDHDWLGDLAPFNQVDNAQLPPNEGLHVFSAAGSKILVEFPDLLELREQPELAVHKAELWLPVSEESLDIEARYPIQDQFFALTVNTDGNPVSTPDQNSIGLNINGNYDADTMAYRFNLSQTVQQMLNGTLEDKPLYLVSNRSGISFQGVKLNGPNDYDAAGEQAYRNARLVLTFSH